MTDEEQRDEPPVRPWITLKTTYDVEAWIDNYNRDLQRAPIRKNAAGYGICFTLSAGGDIYLHTTPEGEILLDVMPEAEWIAPLISAATGVDAPVSQIWALPGEVLTQLVFGLNSLIGSTRIVLEHDFKVKKIW
ncbi:hypothetical protein EGT07_01615 [Herbaspirillum sp. HC18]|nr:hypothetical protein EGT07_01615 [Herbaspirillum sp. HC18]